MEESKISNVCFHYKNTFDIHLSAIKQRDRLFYGLILLLAIMSLQTHSADIVNELISKTISKTTGAEIKKDFSYMSTLVWLFLSVVSIKYYQILIEIERQYSYLHKIEPYVNSFFDNEYIFTREGKNYSNHYSIFSEWVWWLYTIIFPTLLMAIITSNIFIEYVELKKINISFFINSSCFLISMISTIFYLLKIHKNSNFFVKASVACISISSITIAIYILKQ